MRGLATLFILASALVVTPTYSDEGSTLKGPKGVDYGAQGRSIGPIKPTDTLWRIAAKIRPDNSVSIYQVMQALYDKNPSSFLDQNLNHMRDGAYLKIPTIAEMRAVNPTLAKARSEQDDELWEKKKNGTLTVAEINESQKKVTQARKVDLDEAKQELKQEINTIKTEQGTQLVELQKQFKTSVDNVEEILAENNKLKQQLTGISKELETVRDQLGQDSEIQKQLKELIAKQNEIIEQQKAKKIEEDSGLNVSSILSNPFVLGALMFIPALLIIAAVVLFLKKRNNNAPEASDDDEFLPQSPTYTENDELDPLVDNDPLIPDPVEDNDDLSVRLDDDLDQDMLPDDDIIFDDSIDDSFDDDDSVLNQDELEGLLSDDIVFNDESEGSEDDDLDAFLQQDFDQSDDDSLGDEIDLEGEQSQVDSSGDILSADDIDDLFASDNTDDSQDSNKNDDMAALSEELAEDDFDIDSLIDEQNNTTSSEQNEDVNLDDIDDLLDEADETPVGTIDAELIDEDDFDIDSLIDDVQTDEQPAHSSNTLEDESVDADDIDALLDEASDDDALDVDDIDSLLDDVAMDEAATEQALSEEPEVEEQPQVDELVDEDALVGEDELDDALDVDDIDSLLDDVAMDEAAIEQTLSEEPKEDDQPQVDELVDENALVDEDEL
ncbi:FimV N-terminal domain-containing protein, partial [Pseudoalteromonas lipolytica]